MIFINTKNIELTRSDLLQILSITDSNLSKIITRNTLPVRLKEKGYIYIDKKKIGRKSLYIVQENSLTQDKESLNNICTSMFNTRKQKEFSNYYLYRILNTDQAITKEFLSKLSEVSRNTISRWDNKMVENSILSKDGFYYVVMELNTLTNEPKYRLTCLEEYKQFCKNKIIINKRNKALDDYKHNRIDKITYELINDGATASLLANMNKIVYKVTKYQLKQANIDLIQLIKELIIKVYKIDIADYFITLN